MPCFGGVSGVCHSSVVARHGLPPGLAGQLPPSPSGYIRQVVGADVVLVAVATGLIMDIIRGVVRG